jgi:hypothetical protein
MRVLVTIGLLLSLISPLSFAGMVRLDIEGMEYYDWATETYGYGGHLSFLIDETIADSEVRDDIGYYRNALSGGYFWNAVTYKNYYLDPNAQNHIQVEIYPDLLTGIAFRGAFLDEKGNSLRFDLWMQATLKLDDYLDNLKSHVSVWENTVIFNLFEPFDHFQGATPKLVKFTSIVEVPDPASGTLFILGASILFWRNRRYLSTH